MRRIAAALVALCALVPAAASAATLAPSQWPDELGLGSAPNAIRFGGTDRFQTSLAMVLALRGEGGFPFDTPDRTSGGAASLADAAGWWGASTCPAAIIVVAGDTPADALAAAPLSDPTNLSNEPRLQRVAAADPLFDPVGGFDRVDTEAAPILVTRSGRAGASALSPAARVAAADLATGGCHSAREAIIVGGRAAVPDGVEDELVSIGYREVFRVAGTDRYETAADIAVALGTEAAPTSSCVDPVVADGRTDTAFYANAVIEFRPDAQTCRIQGRSVVLADGTTGADALAAGWWTSFWQVPVLLVAGDGTLPQATRTALQTMDIETLVVLGGTGRIPEATVDEAKRLAGAVAGRFAGRDRYETSVAMARVFGGWHATADAGDYVADRVCVAASGGTGAAAGWPDALAAGPWCGRLAVDSSARPSPSRAFEPIEDSIQAHPSRPPAHDAAPILLVPAGAAAPTDAVADLLATSFVESGRWCTGGFTGVCRMPGFAAAFGGSASVSDAALASISALLAGGDGAQRGADPELAPPFVTDLDLAPVYGDAGGAGGSRACFDRGEVSGVRWLAAYDGALETFGGAGDLVGRDDLFAEESLPMCLRVDRGSSPVAVLGLSTAGRHATPRDIAAASELTATRMSDDVHADGMESSGEPGPDETPGATTTWTFSGPDATDVVITERARSRTINGSTVDIVLTRRALGTTARFIADVTIRTDDGTSTTGRATGEAVLVGDRWELAGRSTLGDAVGGFRASVLTYGSADGADDDLFWRLDGIAP